MQSVVSLPADCHLQIRHTAIKLVGELGPWVQANPAFLQPVFHFIYQSVQTPDLMRTTVVTLKWMCTNCRELMFPFYGEMLTVRACPTAPPVHSAATLFFHASSLPRTRTDPRALPVAGHDGL